MNNINEQLQALVNIDLEMETVGTLIRFSDCINDSVINHTDLHDPTLSNIMYIINLLHKNGKEINEMEILNVASQKKKVDKIGGIKFITELSGTAVSPSRFVSNQKILLENRKKFEAIKMLNEKMNEILESELSEFQENLIKDFTKLTDSNSIDNEDGSVIEAVKNVMEDMNTERNGITGAKTGFTLLDEYLDGFRKEKLVIIGARPGAGKTALVMNMAQTHGINNNLPCVVFSMEMSKEELIKRMISSVGLIDSDLMRNPLARFQEKHWNDSAKAMGAIAQSKIRIFDKPSVDMAYIKQKCRMISRQFKGEHMLVFIDYLQLIKGDPRLETNKNIQIGEISKALKVLSRELKCTVICLSQLGREVEKRQDKRPIMSDIRDSGQVEQDADVIGMLYRDDYYNPDSKDKDILEFIVAKNRDGKVGTIKLLFKKELSKITNLTNY